VIDRLGKHLLRRFMSGNTRPISIRLTNGEIEQLHARAHRLSANITGVARDLIRTGLVGGDNKALADRLMRIERRMVAVEQQGQETHTRVQSIDKAAHDLLAMFEALLKALTGETSGRAA
jgi:predicted  nucleic acid-binding Zn-ribbon protein